MSFVTSNEVRQYILQVFGKGVEIVEATFPIRIQPTPDDVVGADPRDPGNCVFVHTVKRMYGSQVVVFWKKVAYIDMLDTDGVRRVFRLLIPKEASERLGKFDRGEPFEIGTAITLKQPPKAQTLKANRTRSKVKKAKTKRHVDRRKQLASVLVEKRKAAKVADERLKKAVAQDAKNVVGIKDRKEAADAALKAVQAKIAKMDQATAKRAPKKFDLTTRNGAAGNYNFKAIHRIKETVATVEQPAG